MGDKSVGTYARLSIIDAEGKELEKHYVRACVRADLLRLGGVSGLLGMGKLP